MTTLRLPQSVLAAIVAEVRAGYPRETCGLLIGKQADEEVTVVDSVAAPNLNRDRPEDRYELDPKTHLTAERDARHRGLAIVGVWHSHPDHPAAPSEIDRAEGWEGWSYLILSVSAEGVRDLRSWRLCEGQFVKEPIESWRG